jgi:uncharacterized protein YndB with AHSA1/START domain
MRVRASRELLAPVEDVWGFLAEPRHLADWWPGIAGVEPDRRGLATGARWLVTGGPQPGLLRRPNDSWTLVVTAAEPARRFAFHLTGDRLDAELTLEARGRDRTEAELELRSPFLLGTRRGLAKQALERLHALVQTGAN